MWRKEVEHLHRPEFPDGSLNPLYVDNPEMQLARDPRRFDVMLTDTIFGDFAQPARHRRKGNRQFDRVHI